ncbi:hypothetical protein TorRG33x02_181000, partial [Trema orientale]
MGFCRGLDRRLCFFVVFVIDMCGGLTFSILRGEERWLYQGVSSCTRNGPRVSHDLFFA